MGAETKEPTEQTCDNGRDKNGTGKERSVFQPVVNREAGKQKSLVMIPGLRLDVSKGVVEVLQGGLSHIQSKIMIENVR